MIEDPRLDALVRFEIRTVSRDTDSSLVAGSFSRTEGIGVDYPGSLFISDTEWSIADIVSLDGNAASLKIPNWSMNNHVRENAVFPWLDGYWQAYDVAFLLDDTRDWTRVKYQATDAVRFATRILRCSACGWTTYPTVPGLQGCMKCSSELTEVEIFGTKEAVVPLSDRERFVEIRQGFWDHDHCLICNVAIGRDTPWGYRDSALADGPNSSGIWLCENCFDNYLKRRDFSFLVRRS